MRRQEHPLAFQAPGNRRTVISHHYGAGDTKVYVQASLHADEIPGMLVAHHLHARLLALESAGDLCAEVVLVPVANPLGLAQQVLRHRLGRFEFASGENFNRHYPQVAEAAAALLAEQLGKDPFQNRRHARAALRQAVAAVPAESELAALRKTLLGLAIDADVVLDLHCDNEAVMHLYTGTAAWPLVEPLARYLGSEASLLAEHSGDHPFDEACANAWRLLHERFGAAHPLGAGCVAVTVELRGNADIDHATAKGDADALIAYLQHQGHVAGTAPPLPPLLQPATPLAGSEAVQAPATGVVVFLRHPGERVSEGERIAEIVDPLTAEVTPVTTHVAGLLYARESCRFVIAGNRLAKVAGAHAFRSGSLLSAR
jgi:hypothetical protein